MHVRPVNSSQLTEVQLVLRAQLANIWGRKVPTPQICVRNAPEIQRLLVAAMRRLTANASLGQPESHIQIRAKRALLASLKDQLELNQTGLE